MIHRRKMLSPRSGLNENSPALQCWVNGGIRDREPVKRATEGHLISGPLSPASRALGREERSFPSDKSLGYFQSSASRTLFTIALTVFFLSRLGSAVFAQTTPSPIPTVSPRQQVTVPPIAVDYRANTTRPMPPLTRVGVDSAEQQPLTLREAIALALQNNKEIEVARDNVKIAEFDLLTAHGAYDPRLSAQSYFERIKTPAASFLSGATGAVENSDFTATTRFEGLTPKAGGNYRLDFSSVRSTTNNQFTALNPQYPTALTFTYTQPLVRGLRFDLPRRQIEVANKNLSLTDAQFRQRAIEVITNVQRSYWDLVFTLRNLQIQRDSLTDARSPLEHNRRMVAEGSLAPIDVVAAETQVANFEQAEFAALEDVNRSENNLKNLIAENPHAKISSVSILDPNLIGGYPQSLGNLASNRFNNFRVGVAISLPLHNRTAEGQLGHSLVEGKRIATQREQLEQLIQVEVRNALQSLSTAEARLRAAAVARSTAEQQYESEKRKLDAGQSTVFLVLERQTALATAKGNELRAQTDLNKAIAELQRATGNSLTANNVTVTVK